MIIYGSKNKPLAKEVLTEKCPCCGTQNSIDMYVIQKYAHVFWIPFISIGKTGISQCSHCKQVLTLKEMPSSLKAAYETIKGQTKTPFWIYTGAVLLGLAICSAGYSDIQKSNASKKYISHLAPDDILEYKTEEGHYTLLKVSDVKGDTVFLRANKKEALLKSGLDKISKRDDAFDSEIFYSSQQVMTQLFRKEEILNVIRR